MRKIERRLSMNHRSPEGFGVRQFCGALWGIESGAGPLLSKTLPRLSWPFVRFMVPMHAKNRKEAFHEPSLARRFWSAPVLWRFVGYRKRRRTAALQDAAAAELALCAVHGPNACEKSKG